MGEADVVRDGGWWGARALRHQLSVLQRQPGPDRVRFTQGDQALVAALPHRLPRDVLKRRCTQRGSRVYPIDSARLPGPVLSRVRRG